MRGLIERPAIYVGTYKKYNEGSLFGKWLYPDEYADRGEFIDACLELHNDEEDPELMYQDWENIPGDMCSECDVKAALWEYMEACDRYDQAAVDAYIEEFDTWDERKFEDRYVGEYSLREYAEEFFDEVEECPEHLREYIDMDAYASDMRHGYTERNGYLFRND